MEKLRFNILKRAHDRTRNTGMLISFFNERGIDANKVKDNPDYYEELIMQYSRNCITQEFYEESRERMKEEFKQICDFHRKNKEQLVEQFCLMTKEMIKDESGYFRQK